jgi:Short C-terminal domain
MPPIEGKRPSMPSPEPDATPSRSEVELAEALTKLKALLDSGVLTEEQYEAERKRLRRDPV